MRATDTQHKGVDNKRSMAPSKPVATVSLYHGQEEGRLPVIRQDLGTQRGWRNRSPRGPSHCTSHTLSLLVCLYSWASSVISSETAVLKRGWRKRCQWTEKNYRFLLQVSLPLPTPPPFTFTLPPALWGHIWISKAGLGTVGFEKVVQESCCVFSCFFFFFLKSSLNKICLKTLA